MVYRPRPAHRAGVGPEPLRAPRATLSGALCLLVAAYLAAAGCQQEIPAAPKKTAAAAPGAGARAVRVVPAAETTVARTVAATGTLAADEQVVLGTKVVGRLAEISVDLGSLVKKGQPIASIDTKDYQYRLDQSVAALKQARVRLGLPADGDDDRVDAAQTAVVRQAKAQLDQAQLNRDRLARLWEQQYVARAELDAAVSAFQVAEGRYQDALEEVQNRQAMLLQRRSEVELAASSSPTRCSSRRSTAPWSSGRPRSESTSPPGRRWYPRAPPPLAAPALGSGARSRRRTPGQPVRVTVDGDPTRITPARWRACRRRSPSRTARWLIEAEVPNTREPPAARLFAKAEVVVQADGQIVTVPATALVIFRRRREGDHGPGRQDRGVARATGRRLGDRIEIVSGVRRRDSRSSTRRQPQGGQAVTVEK